VTTLRATEKDGDVTVDIVVQPRASREGIALHDDRLKVSVNAPPVDGKANAAVLRVLADTLSVARGNIEILRGETGRRKTVRIRGVTLAALLRAVGAGEQRAETPLTNRQSTRKY
jgi:uncharacterized protein (TIGR00251 family)